jgi:hypothetical protein
MHKRLSLLLLTCLAALAAVSGTQAAVHHGSPAKPRAVHKLKAPGLVGPAAGARVLQVPTLVWSSVSGAAEYEYQISADPKFDSIVLGKGVGTGTSKTHNLAAALSKSIADGKYYWRVRGVSAANKAGAWSQTRTLIKAWSAAPQLLGPGDGAAVTWPSTPLVLSWTAVPNATEYIVTIATDPALSNVVLGSAKSPQKTDATLFAFPATLSAGQYYWAITPVDAEGHRGARSSVSSFSWSWPTSTTTQVNDLNPDPRVFDPQFSWAPVPGAARYEVEVNSASDFPVGSKWCCSDLTTGTSLSPTIVLANNEYYWRVRAIDAGGNAGVWNVGPSFTKAFDSVTPTIPDLTMSDVNGNPLPPGESTNTPIITWSPVAGAARYELQFTPYVLITGTEFGCNWANEKSAQTATLAWTPGDVMGKDLGSERAWPGAHSNEKLTEGNTYCARVLAFSDNDAQGNAVISNWTQIGGENQPAFTFSKQPPVIGAVGTNPLIPYVLPGAPGATPTTPRTPLFTWQRVEGAASYDVVIARDAGFTHVIDIGSTTVPAYAPQLVGEQPLNDETTAYYWAVVPFNAKGEEFAEPPVKDQPQTFNKSSVPPAPLAPVGGVEVPNQPTFSWSPAEGELNYTLQVSEDPTFGSPIDNVKTDSISYTSSSTYPSNITLYWRVRANNAKGVGLNWSSVQTFRKTLPVPSPASGNPSGGQGIPALSWTPVTGATSYQIHVDQANGTTKEFSLNSTSFTPTEWYGTGIWRWAVRARFSGSSSVTGGFFAPQTFVRTLAPPTGVVGVKAGSRIVISWNSDPYAKQYEVDLSTNENFTSTIESRRVDGLGWAPDVDPKKSANRGTLYWRVAAIDQGGNLSPFASGRFVAPHHKVACTKKKKKHSKLKKCVVRKPAKKKHG